MPIQLLLDAAGLYFGFGLLFAVAFVWKAVTVIDEAARGSTIGFRLLILPGVILFWPLMLIRWRRAVKKPGV